MATAWLTPRCWRKDFWTKRMWQWFLARHLEHSNTFDFRTRLPSNTLMRGLDGWQRFSPNSERRGLGAGKRGSILPQPLVSSTQSPEPGTQFNHVHLQRSGSTLEYLQTKNLGAA